MLGLPPRKSPNSAMKKDANSETCVEQLQACTLTQAKNGENHASKALKNFVAWKLTLLKFRVNEVPSGWNPGQNGEIGGF